MFLSMSLRTSALGLTPANLIHHFIKCITDGPNYDFIYDLHNPMQTTV